MFPPPLFSAGLPSLFRKEAAAAGESVDFISLKAPSYGLQMSEDVFAIIQEELDEEVIVDCGLGVTEEQGRRFADAFLPCAWVLV